MSVIILLPGKESDSKLNVNGSARKLYAVLGNTESFLLAIYKFHLQRSQKYTTGFSYFLSEHAFRYFYHDNLPYQLYFHFGIRIGLIKAMGDTVIRPTPTSR